MTSFDLDLSKYQLGWSDEVEYAFAPAKGINEGVVDQISWWKGEPRWMSNFRKRSLRTFERKPMAPWFAVNMPDIDFQNIYYYLKPATAQVDEWDQLPAQMQATYEKLGIPEAERQYLSGVTAQYESEVVFHRNREELASQGILFCDMDTALREYPDIIKQYFGTVIPPGDNKFAALNSSVWSGGSFVYVPEGVEVEMPLQAYFRINSENAGQFERTLIIAEAGSKVHYIEGCSAPVYTSDSLHSAVVEIIVKPSARVTYTTIQNWSPNVYNLVTKRAKVEAEGHMEWIDGNIGCLAEGSTITTRGGVKPIEHVTPGEEVLSYDDVAGELCWRRVVAKRNSGEQMVREVTMGERRLRVTDNHPFLSYVYDPDRPKKLGRYDLSYVRADQLTKVIVPVTSLDYGGPHKLVQPDDATDFLGGNQYVGQYAARRRRARASDLPETTDPDLMWLFGLYVGDGSLETESASNGGHRWARVTFSVPTGDRARARLESILDQIAPGVPRQHRSEGRRGFCVQCLDWRSSSSATGSPVRRLTKRVPDWVCQLPESQRGAFVAGYLDADGCAARGRRGFSLKSVNSALLADVANVLTTMGITSRIHTEYARRASRDDSRDISQ